jgi:hypothetical protein
MANTLTGLIPTIYEAMDIVARELVGFIPAVYRNSSAARAAVDETIRYPIVPAITLVAGSAGQAAGDNGDAAVSYADVTLNKDYYAPVRINGEEAKGLGNSGQDQAIMRDRFAQAIRALTNAIEADLAALYPYASRAQKTTGTRLFDETDGTESLAELRRILMDNGAQGQELQLVLGSSAGARIRSEKMLVEVDRSGSNQILRSGIIGLPLLGFDIHESAQVARHTNGTYGAATVTALAEGGTVITGTNLTDLVAGDLLKIANDDDNVYVLNATPTDAAAAAINAPGSLVAHAAASDLISPLIATSYKPNLAFARNAIHLVTRAPAMPSGGDAADDAYMITDPLTGLTFEVRMYREHRQVKYEVCCVWGVAAVKPDFIAILAE